jgi:hypothetical protein
MVFKTKIHERCADDVGFKAAAEFIKGVLIDVGFKTAAEFMKRVDAVGFNLAAEIDPISLV